MMGLPSLALKKEKRQIERVVALKCSGLPPATPKETLVLTSTDLPLGLAMPVAQITATPYTVSI